MDTGAVEPALAEELIERLQLEEVGRIRAQAANGDSSRLRVLGMVELEVQGRRDQVEVVEPPRGARPLLGSMPLELMD